MPAKETGTLLTKDQRTFLLGQKKLKGHTNPSKMKADIKKTFQKLPEITKVFFSDFQLINMFLPETKEEMLQKEKNYDTLSGTIQKALLENPLIETENPEIKEKISKNQIKQWIGYQAHQEAYAEFMHELHNEFKKPRIKAEKKALIKLYKERDSLLSMDKSQLIPNLELSMSILKSLEKRGLIVIDHREEKDWVLISFKGRYLARTFEESL